MEIKLRNDLSHHGKQNEQPESTAPPAECSRSGDSGSGKAYAKPDNKQR